MLKAIEIVHGHVPVIQYKKGFQPITAVGYLGGNLHDVAIIDIIFKPDHYYELADCSKSEYVVQEIRSPGESGLPLLNHEGKICGILSKSNKKCTFYSGINNDML